MKINRVTITGADNEIYIKDLVDIWVRFPFVEYGILHSDRKIGTLRYPDLKWLNLIEHFGFNELPLSAHLCGQLAKSVIEDGNFDFLNRRKQAYGRFQLNYNFKYAEKQPKWERMFNWLMDNPKKSIILQVNKSNQEVINGLTEHWSMPNIHFLYDSSGGRGTEISNILTPFKQYTGYAGGINLDNIDAICKNIDSAFSQCAVWIDMESGVRVSNHFSPNHVIKILERCLPWVMPESKPA